MKYQQMMPTGNWAKTSELKSGTRAKIVSETKPQASQFKDKDGNVKNQDVAKVKFEGMGNDPLNVSLNRATIGGLVEAFGADSIDWQNKILRVETEKMRVGGRSVMALYLIPEGFKKIDDENGFAVIVKDGPETPKTTGTSTTPPTPQEEVKMVEYPQEDINPDDIPW